MARCEYCYIDRYRLTEQNCLRHRNHNHSVCKDAFIHSYIGICFHFTVLQLHQKIQEKAVMNLLTHGIVVLTCPVVKKGNYYIWTIITKKGKYSWNCGVNLSSCGKRKLLYGLLLQNKNEK